MEKSYNYFLSSDFNDLTANLKLTSFLEILSKAISSSTPSRRTVSKRKHVNPTPWWDNDCDWAKRLRHAAYKKYKFTQALDDLILYKKRRAVIKKFIKSKKKKNFRDFAASLNFRVNPSYVWKRCKVLKNCWIDVLSSCARENLQPANLEPDIDKLCPPWVCTNPDILPICPDNEFLASQFTFSEFNLALDDKRVDSSPGMDGISFEALKRLSSKFRLLLVDIFNEMYSQGCFPDSWRDVFVWFIKKPQGQGRRPISLTSCIC